ncbi:MAG TPA: type VI secretion system tip protein TssI/VgrG, partial [Byssovorax sp.]
MSTNVAGPFSLRVGGRGARPLVSLRGREELSRVFRLDARVLCEPDERVAVVGERASVTLSGKDGRGRTVHGVVERVSVEGVIRAGGERVVRVRVVPRLAMLRHRVTSVVHVEQTVPEVVAGALGLAGVRVTTRLTRAYAKRAYCVQYKESTLAFVRRILAEEGVLFTFDHGDADSGEDSVVLFDAAEGYGKLEPQTLTLRRRDAREGRPGSGDDVLEFALESAAAPDRALLRDYDPQKPLLDLRVSARAGVTPPVGGAELLAYEHRGPYAEADVESPPAEVALEQRRRGAVVGRGTSTSRAIAPGLAFRLDAETTPELSGAYAITSIEHDLAQHAERDGQLVYENRFTCAPADVAHRPPRPRQRVRQVLETAIVVGPAGEEIHTDALGRVQVRFHWQIGDAGDGASTWLRVVQPWTGAGFGAHFVPRVGSEVMVTFLGGDPDAPVVVGGVYNATSPPPFALPADKTRSGLRTRTSPGGAGANELSFEDAAGSEQIFLKAQRDLDIDVGRDATTHVKRNASRVVGGSDTSDTAGDARAQIGGDHAVT